jgi:mannose-6-phosphate isomerase class I
LAAIIFPRIRNQHTNPDAVPADTVAVKDTLYKYGLPIEEFTVKNGKVNHAKLCVTAPTDITVGKDSFAFLLCLDGKGSVTANGLTCDVARADGYYLPAALGKVTLDGNMTVLVARMG